MFTVNFRKISVPIVFLVLVLVISWPLFNDKFIPVHDFTAGTRIYDLKQAFLDGQFPARWAKDFGFGYGMPLFQFYAPLFFYVATFFNLLGFSVVNSLKITIIASTLLGIWGMYKLAYLIFKDKAASLIVTTAFAVAPYHAVNLYVRGAFAEMLAINFSPWVLYWTLQLFQKSPSLSKVYLFLTLSLAGVFLSHNVSVLTFIPFWGLFVLIFSLWQKNYKPLFFSILSALHAILISAFFLIPAFYSKQFTRVDEITGGFSDYQIHFLYFRQLFYPNWKYGGSVWGIEDDMSFYLGNDIFLMAVVGSLVFFITQWFSLSKNIKYREKLRLLLNKQSIQLITLTAFLFFLSILLTTFKSKYFWPYLPLFQFIQFPWRFLGMSSLFLALLAGGITQIQLVKRFWFVPVILIIVLNGQYFKPRELIPVGEMYNPNPQYIRDTMSSILPDYLPKGADWKNMKTGVEEAFVWEGKGDVALIKNTTNHLTLEIKNSQGGVLQLNRYVFPNWQIFLDRKLITCLAVVSEDLKMSLLYRCNIPEGDHELKLQWSEMGVNFISNIISLLGIVGLIGIVYKMKKYHE